MYDIIYELDAAIAKIILINNNEIFYLAAYLSLLEQKMKFITGD